MQFVNSYARLDARLYHKQPPTPLASPQAGHFNPFVAQQIGWDSDAELMRNWVDIVSGHEVPQGFEPLAMAYAGHQFGHWAGQLGDGRGLLMAQVADVNGNLTDLHLKGVGLTPYSRMGDGRAVLRSTIREYLCGHAMASLGIRSSNALGFVTSKTGVQRETLERGAALMRVSDTHIRLGHIEWIASFAPDLLAEFTEYMRTTYYPELAQSATPIHDFITEVVKRTAVMIADWQLIGFAHGVMNTDNLSITGTTLDYGPFGFLERFNPAWINNHSDHTGRYAYQNQPAIGHWNLQIWMRHFLALSPQNSLADDLDSNATNSSAASDYTANSNAADNTTSETLNQDSLDACLAHYETSFMRHYHQGICRKLGLPWWLEQAPTDSTAASPTLSDTDTDIINATLALAFEFLSLLEDNSLDYTNSFRALLALVQPALEAKSDAMTTNNSTVNNSTIKKSGRQHEQKLLATMTAELQGEQLLRWQQWQTAYKAHIGTYLEHQRQSYYRSDNPATAQNPDADKALAASISIDAVIDTLKNTNPVYVLRNAMAQHAIEQAQRQAQSADFAAGHFNEVDRLFTLLATPYQVQDIATKADTTPPAKNEAPLIVSCSS